MNKTIKNLILVLFLFSGLFVVNSVEAFELSDPGSVVYVTNFCGEQMIQTQDSYTCVVPKVQTIIDADTGISTTEINPYVLDGQVCVYNHSGLGGTFVNQSIRCTTFIPATYTAEILSSSSIRGSYNDASSNTVTTWSKSFFNFSSPYLYIHNAPAGTISITPDSDLDIFKSAQPFTTANTWLLNSSGYGQVSLAGEEVEHLFYRLAIDDIKLSRYGRNFSSKAEVIEYLKTSDFLAKLGLSEAEAANSLETIVGDINVSKASPYYYLTVLDESSITDVSKLNISPNPEELIRSYFVVYPTPVPVKTSGDFVFPVLETIGSEYTIKETGELLIGNDTFVSFN